MRVEMEIPNSAITYEVKDRYDGRWEVTIRCGEIRLAELEFEEGVHHEESGWTIYGEEDAVDAALIVFGTRLKAVLGL